MRRFANRWSLGKWRQRHSATGRYWQFFRRPLKFAFRFASITITVANSEGNLKEAAVIETSHVTKNPQCECITLDRTPFRMPGEPTIARARQSRVKLAANHLLDQSANLPADHVFDRIKPIVKKVGVGLDCRMRKFRLAGNILHGVVSWPALQRR